jgi:hypothetical protein
MHKKLAPALLFLAGEAAADRHWQRLCAEVNMKRLLKLVALGIIKIMYSAGSGLSIDK